VDGALPYGRAPMGTGLRSRWLKKSSPIMAHSRRQIRTLPAGPPLAFASLCPMFRRLARGAIGPEADAAGD
jgi:hypothetical protein